MDYTVGAITALLFGLLDAYIRESGALLWESVAEMVIASCGGYVLAEFGLFASRLGLRRLSWLDGPIVGSIITSIATVVSDGYFSGNPIADGLEVLGDRAITSVFMIAPICALVFAAVRILWKRDSG
jgi:hypothetical protein